MSTVVGRAIRTISRMVSSRSVMPPAPRCVSVEVRTEGDILRAAGLLARGGEPTILPSLIRDLVRLNTPALFLNIVDHRAPARVVLEPWEGRSIRFQGSAYLATASSEAPEGVEAFAAVPFSHVTALYPTAPDHPVYVMAIEWQGDDVYCGRVPPYLTHASIMVNGRLLTHGERLLRERGVRVWWAA